VVVHLRFAWRPSTRPSPPLPKGRDKTNSFRHERGARAFGWLAPSSVAAALVLLPTSALSGVPDISQSFFVPQRGSVGSPIEGNMALQGFRTCPNNDAFTGAFQSCRIKVVVRDVNGNGIPDIAAADICILFNGGTPAQGFSGVGADSVISAASLNLDPPCPDLRCIPADAPTDANGVTYITFIGATPGSPGVGTRDPNRKWGHYDSELPVYAQGFKLSGRLTTASPNGSYILRIKNLDVMEGLGPDIDEGEAVTTADFSTILHHVGMSSGSPLLYWLDFNSDGIVTITDFNLLVGHINHDCDTPNNP
jgi:hypothetical protein